MRKKFVAVHLVFRERDLFPLEDFDEFLEVRHG